MKKVNYQELFELALNKSGKLLKGYSMFHRYSYVNQLLAMFQMMEQGLDITPLNTYKGWQALGHQVQKGSKAIAMRMPITIKDKETDEEKMIFILRKNWFCMAQTDAKDAELPTIDFDFEKCLKKLKINRIKFTLTDGNVQGFAKEKSIAINPVAELADKTFFHEVGHILLGHTKSNVAIVDSKDTEKNIKEVEAESVALCVSLALGLEKNVDYCVGYIKSWLQSNEMPLESIKKIFKVTNQILQAGKVE